MKHNLPSFVCAAQISAHLGQATEVAKSISLTAKNARAITVRAGRLAAGFKAITDFIEEFAKFTMDSAETINGIAVTISKLATQQVRTKQAMDIFTTTSKQSLPPKFTHSIEPALIRSRTLINNLNAQLAEQILLLDIQLDETQKQTRSATVISTTARVEASQAGKYQRQLDSIADAIDTASEKIRQALTQARLLLRSLQEATDEGY